MLHLKAVLAVIIVAGLLALPLYFYSEFLNQGQSATASAQILNALQKNGVRDFSLPNVDGKQTYTLGQFQGKLVLLNFWASWCVPCVKEFPSMIALTEKMGGKLVTIAVSQDSNEEDLRTFLKAFEPFPKDFLILWDRQKVVAKEYGTEILPESYIIGPQGNLVRKIVGVEVWDHDQALEFFNDLAKQAE